MMALPLSQLRSRPPTLVYTTRIRRDWASCLQFPPPPKENMQAFPSSYSVVPALSATMVSRPFYASFRFVTHKNILQVIQLAKISGFSPIITTASLKHAEYLQSLGATSILDRNLPSSALVAEISKITDKPVRAVYDAISSDETQQAGLDILASKGQLAVVGAPKPKPTDGKSILFVTGGIGVPTNVELLSKFYHDILYGFLEKGWLKVSLIRACVCGLH
jgi:hypothetical protein